MRIALVSVVAVIVAVSSVTLRADTIRLRSGQTITGSVLSADSTVVKVMLDNGMVANLRVEEISNIEYSARTAPPPPPPDPSRAPEPVTIPAGTVLNVNMPGNGSDAYEWTTLGRRLYEDDVAERLDPRGRSYYWVGGGPAGHEHVDGTDCVAIAEGRNTITPMHLDLTDRKRLATPPWGLDGFRVVVGSAP
jgi:hypothetical protein